MANNKVSVLIAARSEPYLQETIDSCFDSAEGDVEVIAVLDGYWPEVPIKEHKGLILVHHPNPVGQRPGVNEAAKLATGKYIMKLDAHCILSKGYDVRLAADCKYDWTMIPRRYGVIEDEWVRRKRSKVDYMRLTCLTEPNDLGLRAVQWKHYESNGKKIDDVMTCQGSGWFQHRDRFFEHGCLDEKHGQFGALGCEVGCKAWLSGGKLKVNKNVWYAHWQRGRRKLGDGRIVEDPRRLYAMPRRIVRIAHEYARALWLENKWPLQVRDFKWLVDKFSPVPGWENWKWTQ